MINVVAAILKNGEKILIARKKKGKPLEGYYEFPGGKIEAGETAEEALVRELKEEMSIDIKVIKYIGESVYNYKNYIDILLKGFIAEIVDGEIELRDHDEYIWVTLEEINTFNLAPADIPLVSKLIKVM